jgi:protein-S-isoprenylcysteine O-methyltransferase Ste14
MQYLLRHLLAIAVLPGMVAVAVPIVIARAFGVTPTLPTTLVAAAAQLFGVAFGLTGVGLAAASVYHFATYGRGTLGPWDPPRHLVVRGPYRFVRNPMIAGVMSLLVGESLFLRSTPHAFWAAIAITVNVAYIVVVEERQLVARFGDEYRNYQQHVPRFVPRLTPWRSPEVLGRSAV